MALTSTIHTFDIALADSDRGVYEDLSIRAARHPSETDEFLWTRVLAYCLEYEEGIGFSKGVSDGDEPAIAVRDPAGRYKAWIEVGAPDADRLHRGAKGADRVAVYSTRDWHSVKRQLEGKRIHRGEEIPFYVLDGALLDELVSLLDRRMSLHLAVTGRQLYLDVAGRSFNGEIAEYRLGPA